MADDTDGAAPDRLVGLGVYAIDEEGLHLNLNTAGPDRPEHAATGGSDFHRPEGPVPLGHFGVDAAALAALRARCRV